MDGRNNGIFCGLCSWYCEVHVRVAMLQHYVIGDKDFVLFFIHIWPQFINSFLSQVDHGITIPTWACINWHICKLYVLILISVNTETVITYCMLI